VLRKYADEMYLRSLESG
jgi:hypothetical protein